MYISLTYAHTHCRDIIHYVRTFWKNVFIDIAYLYASPRRADIMNYVPTEGVFLISNSRCFIGVYGTVLDCVMAD